MILNDKDSTLHSIAGTSSDVYSLEYV